MNKKRNEDQDLFGAILDRIEFHRNGLCLLPEPGDRRPGVAYLVTDDKSRQIFRSCTCAVYKKKTCPHMLELIGTYKTLSKRLGGKSLEEDFKSSVWHRLAGIMAEASSLDAHSVSLKSISYPVKDDSQASADSVPGPSRVIVTGQKGEEILHYLSQGPECNRFIERFAKGAKKNTVPTRSSVLKKLVLLTLTENERAMNDRGFKTRGQVLEDSFWYRLAYHGYREFGATGCTFNPAIEETTGEFTVTCKRLSTDSDTGAVFRMAVPRLKVKGLISALNKLLPNQHNMAIHPVPLKSIFYVSANTELDLEVRPLIEIIQADGETKYLAREEVERFRYGDLVYVKELGLLAELEQPGRLERRFKSPVSMVLKKSQVPSFLDDFKDELLNGSHIVDAKVKQIRIYRQPEQLVISPNALERDWCWLSVKYGIGNTSISLEEILKARAEGQRFINTDGGWVDCMTDELDTLGSILDRAVNGQYPKAKDQLRLSRMDLFRIKAIAPNVLQVTGENEMAGQLKNMLHMQPMRHLPELKGAVSILRPYQKLGVEWIRFLFENGLGGLLCDDMGLGKTHEVMHFMVALREYEKITTPFLVVCPTTVLGHWNAKIREHAPTLRPVLYHGAQRDLEEAFKKGDVLLTSYGVLRNDIEKLKEIRFALAVFDEIQNLKNSETHAHIAARAILADMKLGVTGTPIENSLIELKTLMDVTLPGYLGSDSDFEARYIKPIESGFDDFRREKLSRLISPFALRRRKETVLDDLPEKIEDIRTCELSDDQVKFYRDAVATRGSALIQSLKKSGEPVPYIHIFALLSLLKQICNHPATVEGKVDDYEQYDSGKWELLKELLSESLDSGQKVVVYSQFLDMIKIIELHLKGRGVNHVTLTGSSRNRDESINRFNNDPDCRVFVGSLMAGGVGIDLVAASVVIHYDRWWNAAKEDQATDRVHRIGQRRGVQVFKLVTEGTLEEKISAIIEKKRDLMEGIVKENDPGILKTMTRNELIDLLSAPVR